MALVFKWCNCDLCWSYLSYFPYSLVVSHIVMTDVFSNNHILGPLCMLCIFCLYHEVLTTGGFVSFLHMLSITVCLSCHTETCVISLRFSNCVICDRKCWTMWFCALSPLFSGEDMCTCIPAHADTHLHFCVYPPKKKNVVCADLLSGWPRDRLVITSVSLSGINYRASGKTPLLSSLCLYIFVLVIQHVRLLQGSPLI